MSKKEVNLVPLGVIFTLFLIFLFLRGIDGLTGYTVFDLTSNSTLDLNNVSLSRFNSSYARVYNLSTNEFFKDDLVLCNFTYNFTNVTQLGDYNFTVGFYSGNINNPDLMTNTILFNNSVCSSSVCNVTYNITSFKLGNWNCFVRFNNTNLVSTNSLVMRNRAPILVRNISEISLNLSGDYLNGASLKLEDYFNDLDGTNLEYRVRGDKVLGVSITGNLGRLRFTNPALWEGTEYLIFGAFDGINLTESNNVSVVVGSGVTRVTQLVNDTVVNNTPVCNVVWDCKWSQCQNSIQNCVYFDKNNCNLNQNKPVDLTRPCNSGVQQQTNSNAQLTLGSNQEGLNNTSNLKSSNTGGFNSNLLIIGIVLILFVAAVVGVFFFLGSRKSSVSGITGTSQENTNSNQLNKYIYDALNKGQNDEKLKSDLLKAGWNNMDIQNSFNYAKLKRFVDTKIKEGIDKEKIRYSLISKGWKKDLVDSILKD